MILLLPSGDSEGGCSGVRRACFEFGACGAGGKDCSSNGGGGLPALHKTRGLERSERTVGEGWNRAHFVRHPANLVRDAVVLTSDGKGHEEMEPVTMITMVMVLMDLVLSRSCGLSDHRSRDPGTGVQYCFA